MVFALLLALTVFALAGLVNMDTDRLTPFMPNGFSPVLAATVQAFFSYAGFMVIIEIGGEIKNPTRNIPLALAISFITVLLLYTLVSVAIVGVIPWQELGDINACQAGWSRASR
jgi:APA family basic amino acid/polyamine antiporter